MTSRLKIVLITAATVAVCSHAADADDSQWNYDFARTPFGESIDKATMRMLKETFDESNDKNVVSSPLTVQILLTRATYWYSFGAPMNTEEQVAQALGTPDYSQSVSSYNDLLDSYDIFDENHLSLQTCYFISDQHMITHATIGFGPSRSEIPAEEKIMGTYLKRLKIEDESGLNEINKWANNKTKGNIPDPITESGFKELILSEVFFQGHWKDDAISSSEKDVQVDQSTTVKKPTIRFKQPVRYRESAELDAKMVEIPFKENGSRMVVVMPNDANGLPTLIEKVAQTGLLKAFAYAANDKKMELELPKFEIKNDVLLKEILEKFGVPQIFTYGSLIYIRNIMFVVEKVFQKSVIKVDEAGSTAAAVSGIYPLKPGVASFPAKTEPVSETADEPFLYAILHEDKVLIAGTYVH